MPGKAAYRELDADDDLNFTYFLADKLGLMVADLEARMSNSEFVMWSRWHAIQGQRRQVGL